MKIGIQDPDLAERAQVFTVSENQSNSRFKALFKTLKFKKGMEDPPMQYVKYTEICKVKSNYKIVNAYFRNVIERSLKTSIWGHKEYYSINVVKFDHHADFIVELNHFKDRGKRMSIQFEAVIQFEEKQKQPDDAFTRLRTDTALSPRPSQAFLADDPNVYKVKVNCW